MSRKGYVTLERGPKKEGECRVEGCPQYGRLLKNLDQHLKRTHLQLSRNAHDALSECVIAKMKLSKTMKNRQIEVCLVDGCKVKGVMTRTLTRHLRTKHHISRKEYLDFIDFKDNRMQKMLKDIKDSQYQPSTDVECEESDSWEIMSGVSGIYPATNETEEQDEGNLSHTREWVAKRREDYVTDTEMPKDMCPFVRLTPASTPKILRVRLDAEEIFFLTKEKCYIREKCQVVKEFKIEYRLSVVTEDIEVFFDCFKASTMIWISKKGMDKSLRFHCKACLSWHQVKVLSETNLIKYNYVS
ncbi:uncharacterized protein LOC135486340 [Lineus longissimus]|uniref:uncharacterized protein LOC135486340 n=1 Tax=Lineus longissimus TaxID=88925 RepID=UPI002B4C2CD7